MEATATPTLSLSVRIELARTSKRELAAWIRKIDRWHAAVDAHINDGAPYPSIRRMPSKNSKHRAYGSAGHVLRCLPELTDAPSHPSTVDELRLVVAAFERRYGK